MYVHASISYLLNTHVSPSLSLSLDQLMRSVGNDRFNSRFEAHIPIDVARPRKNSDRDSRERFIKAKYVERKFFDWPEETDKDYLSAVCSSLLPLLFQ